MSWSTVWASSPGPSRLRPPDLPGLGGSEAPESISLAESACFLKDLLDHLGLGQAVVIGNSFGVELALEFAAALPERPRRVIALNGTSLPVIPAFLRKLMAMPSLAPLFRKMVHSVTYSDKAFSKAFPDRTAFLPDSLKRSGNSKSSISALLSIPF